MELNGTRQELASKALGKNSLQLLLRLPLKSYFHAKDQSQPVRQLQIAARIQAEELARSQ